MSYIYYVPLSHWVGYAVLVVCAKEAQKGHHQVTRMFLPYFLLIQRWRQETRDPNQDPIKFLFVFAIQELNNLSPLSNAMARG